MTKSKHCSMSLSNVICGGEQEWLTYPSMILWTSEHTAKMTSFCAITLNRNNRTDKGGQGLGADEPLKLGGGSKSQQICLHWCAWGIPSPSLCCVFCGKIQKMIAWVGSSWTKMKATTQKSNNINSTINSWWDVEMGWLLQEWPSGVCSEGTATSVTQRREGGWRFGGFIEWSGRVRSIRLRAMVDGFFTGPWMCKTQLTEHLQVQLKISKCSVVF